MEIREAAAEDVEFVAWTVLTALDLDTSDLEKAMASCADADSLYSWRNALVAVDGEGHPVGCIVAYAGDGYRRMRDHTWPTLWTDVDPRLLAETPQEAGPGEYYLDSMAILPEARGSGLGKSLMRAAMDRGRKEGYGRFSLIVDVDKPHLRDYYVSVGFRPVGPLRFIAHDFTKMQLEDQPPV